MIKLSLHLDVLVDKKMEKCDRFARADKYYQIDNLKRSKEFISTLAAGVSNYIKRVEKYQEYEWHKHLICVR